MAGNPKALSENELLKKKKKRIIISNILLQQWRTLSYSSNYMQTLKIGQHLHVLRYLPRSQRLLESDNVHQKKKNHSDGHASFS